MRVAFLPIALAVPLMYIANAAVAEPTGLLYDPEPPADSAYVRLVHASREGPVDVSVDGRMRISKLARGQASHYLVLPAGKHLFTIRAAVESNNYLSTEIDVIKGRAMTVALTALRPEAKPLLFEDRPNANRLKAVLSVYHLNSNLGSVDVLTADGNTLVFSGLRTGASAAISVNPIEVALIATKAGERAPLARTSVAMTQGGTYSILLLAGVDGKMAAHGILNKVERYPGK